MCFISCDKQKQMMHSRDKLCHLDFFFKSCLKNLQISCVCRHFVMLFLNHLQPILPGPPGPPGQKGEPASLGEGSGMGDFVS